MARLASSAAAAAATPDRPHALYHVLMSQNEVEEERSEEAAAVTSHSSQPPPGSGTSTTITTTAKTGRRVSTSASVNLQHHDFLARRYRALEELRPPSKKGNGKANNKKGVNNNGKHQRQVDRETIIWSGASSLEKALVACCVRSTGGNPSSEDNATTDQQNDNDPEEDGDDWSPIAGALARDQVVTFVGRMALHCHTISTRSLALAILERSQEADELERTWGMYNLNGDQYPPDQLENHTNETNVGMEPAAKRTRRSAPPLPVAAAASPTVETTTPADSKPPALLTTTSSSSSSTSNAAPVESMSPRVVRVQQKTPPPARLRLFLQAGGLPILSRWLSEAATPVRPKPSKKASPNNKNNNNSGGNPSGAAANDSSGDAVKVASPTGPLLLPLLLFLQKLPFDLSAIKLSRINRTIKQISKQLDAIWPTVASKSSCAGGSSNATSNNNNNKNNEAVMNAADGNKRDDGLTDPVAGGLSVARVQAAVNELKAIWEERATKTQEKISNKRSAGDNPFAKVLAVLEERAQQLSQYYAQERDTWTTSTRLTNTNNSELLAPLPDWLAQWHASRQPQSGASSKNFTTSDSNTNKHKRTEELARKERENERAAMMKADLAKAQEQRRELLRRLRQKQNETASTTAIGGLAVPDTTTPRRGVKWKDGLGPASRMRNRELLEEVFVFVKDKDVLAATRKQEQQQKQPKQQTGEPTTGAPEDSMESAANTDNEIISSGNTSTAGEPVDLTGA